MGAQVLVAHNKFNCETLCWSRTLGSYRHPTRVQRSLRAGPPIGSTLQQVLHVIEREAQEVVGVLVRGLAIKAFVLDSRARLLTSPIKTERDDRAVLRQIWKPERPDQWLYFRSFSGSMASTVLRSR
jgi:hypothetical protein